MGGVYKNENVTADMIDILSYLHKYARHSQEGRKQRTPIFLRGDQLTCERTRGAQKARVQAENAKDRLKGFAAKVEDWHALMAYYQVIWQVLYSVQSGRDKGTLYQIRNLIDRRNVVQDLKRDLHARYYEGIAVVSYYCKASEDRPRSKLTLSIPKGTYVDFVFK